MKQTAAFVMPVKLGGNETELRHFETSVQSIVMQTDNDWILVMVDDGSDNKEVYGLIDKFNASYRITKKCPLVSIRGACTLTPHDSVAIGGNIIITK